MTNLQDPAQLRVAHGSFRVSSRLPLPYVYIRYRGRTQRPVCQGRWRGYQSHQDKRLHYSRALVNDGNIVYFRILDTRSVPVFRYATSWRLWCNVNNLTTFTGQNQQLVWLNNIFLVVPTLGAFVAAFSGPIYRAHKVVPWIAVLLQAGAFIYLLLILLHATHFTVFNATWFIFVLSFLFVFISGHNSTMVYMLLRNQTSAVYVQKAQQWAGFAYQVWSCSKKPTTNH